jgi:hypothetical protein
MQPVVLDTDVASRLHLGRLTGPLAARLIGRRPLISFVTYGELTQWTEIRSWGGHRRQELADWLPASPSFLAIRRSRQPGASSLRLGGRPDCPSR